MTDLLRLKELAEGARVAQLDYEACGYQLTSQISLALSRFDDACTPEAIEALIASHDRWEVQAHTVTAERDAARKAANLLIHYYTQNGQIHTGDGFEPGCEECKVIAEARLLLSTEKGG